jgi:FtsP/CotA-like multicopper oxidase with cupredoxin domain
MIQTPTTHYRLLAAISCALVGLGLTGCNEQPDLGPLADAATIDAYRTALVTASEGGESAAAPGPTGAGWATLRGQFVFDGTPPQMPPYNVTKEHAICTVNGRPPLQETLLVDSASKGIKNVAIYLRDASRVHDSAQPKTDSVEFDQKHCVFLTHVTAVTVGQSLEIKNSDPTGHNTNILGAGFNQLIPEGDVIPYKVQKETAVPNKVVCSIHPWMVAYMLTRKNAYFAVSDEEGRFEIANVPAGEEIEFQVWHESGAAPGNGLAGATPEAPDMKWSNRGRVTLTLQPDEVKEIKVVVPANAFRG